MEVTEGPLKGSYTHVSTPMRVFFIIFMYMANLAILEECFKMREHLFIQTLPLPTSSYLHYVRFAVSKVSLTNKFPYY